MYPTSPISFSSQLLASTVQFCFCEIGFVRKILYINATIYIYKCINKYVVFVFLSDLFCLAQRPQDPSMLLQMARCSFLRLNDIPLYVCVYTTFSLSIHPLKECSIHWKIVSVSWLLWIMLQWIWQCRYSYEILILFPSAIYPGVGLLDYIAVLLLIFWGTTILFSKMVIPRSNVFFNTSARCITHRTELEWGIKHQLHKHSSLPIWILYFSTELLLPLLSEKRLLGQSTIASTTYHASQGKGSTSDSSGCKSELPGQLLKSKFPGFHPEILIQKVWGGVPNSVTLQGAPDNSDVPWCVEIMGAEPFLLCTTAESSLESIYRVRPQLVHVSNSAPNS